MENKTMALSVRESNTPAFLADAASSIEKMQDYAELLIQSGLVPKHFYELDQYRNPKKVDGKFVGNTAAVILTIQHGMEAGMSMTQALQQIVPVNGLISTKGDGALALIMKSGCMGEWKETTSGSIDDESYSVTLYSKRKDNGREKTVTFSVNDAKRMGLWISKDLAAKEEKFKKSGWWKTPARMCGYRALGFMARDLYPDVLQGMYTEQEALDIEVDHTTYKTDEGITISQGKAEAAQKLTDQAKGTGKGAPSKTRKLNTDKVEDAKVVAEEKPTEPAKVDITEGMDQLDKVALWQRLCDNIGFDPSVLFNDETNKRSTGKCRALIIAINNGILDAHLKEKYPEYSAMKESMEDQPGTKEETSTPGSEIEVPAEITDPGDDGRSMKDCMIVSDFIEENVKDVEDILEMFPDNYNDIEDFYKFATREHIQKALK